MTGTVINDTFATEADNEVSRWWPYTGASSPDWMGGMRFMGNGTNTGMLLRNRDRTDWALYPGQLIRVRYRMEYYRWDLAQNPPPPPVPVGSLTRVSLGGTYLYADRPGWAPDADDYHHVDETFEVPDTYTGGPCYVDLGLRMPSTAINTGPSGPSDWVILRDAIVQVFAADEPPPPDPLSDPVSVRIIRGSDLLDVNTTDAESAFLGDSPSAVETMSGAWGQATGRDHADPGKLTLDLILDTPTHPAIDYESLVTVHLTTAEGRTPVPFWRGWIEEIDIQRRTVHHPDTRAIITTWAWHITVGDVIARAAATKINMSPRPSEHAFPNITTPGTGRLYAIDSATPIPLLSSDILSSGNFLVPETVTLLRPRDVDNQPVLDLLQGIANCGALQVVETTDGCTIGHGPGVRMLTWATLHDDNGGGPFHTPNRIGPGRALQGPSIDLVAHLYGEDNTLRVPSAAIHESARKINRATVLNEVSVGWWHGEISPSYPYPAVGDPTERNSYERNGSVQQSTSQHRLATELYGIQNTPTDPPADPTVYLRTVVARNWLDMTAVPSRALSTAEVITDRVPRDVLERLVTLGMRSITNVIITDHPADLGPSWRSIGGTVNIRGGQMDLALTVEPGSMTGLDPITFDDIPRGEDATFRDGTSVYVEPLFNRVPQNLIIDSTAHVARANHRLYGRYP